MVRHSVQGEDLTSQAHSLLRDAAVDDTLDIRRQPRFAPLRRPDQMIVHFQFTAPPHPIPIHVYTPFRILPGNHTIEELPVAFPSEGRLAEGPQTWVSTRDSSAARSLAHLFLSLAFSRPIVYTFPASAGGQTDGENNMSNLTPETAQWAETWLDAVADGSNTMSQASAFSIEKHGGLEAVKALAEQRGVHLLLLTDDEGNEWLPPAPSPSRSSAEKAPPPQTFSLPTRPVSATIQAAKALDVEQ